MTSISRAVIAPFIFSIFFCQSIPAAEQPLAKPADDLANAQLAAVQYFLEHTLGEVIQRLNNDPKLLQPLIVGLARAVKTYVVSGDWNLQGNQHHAMLSKLEKRIEEVSWVFTHAIQRHTRELSSNPKTLDTLIEAIQTGATSSGTVQLPPSTFLRANVSFFKTDEWFAEGRLNRMQLTRLVSNLQSELIMCDPNSERKEYEDILSGLKRAMDRLHGLATGKLLLVEDGDPFATRAWAKKAITDHFQIPTLLQSAAFASKNPEMKAAISSTLNAAHAAICEISLTTD